MNTEILVYRVPGLVFLVGLPVALVFIVLPVRTKRIRWGSVAFMGLASLLSD
jgi:hypothetical protein